MVATGDVGLAFGMVVGAGAASSLGSCIVFCVGLASPLVVAASLAFAAGVMLYVVFTEIFMQTSNASFVDAGYSTNAAYRLATACFFGGVLGTAALDAAVHALMHWGAARRRRQAASKAARLAALARNGSGRGSDSSSQVGKPRGEAELVQLASSRDEAAAAAMAAGAAAAAAGASTQLAMLSASGGTAESREHEDGDHEVDVEVGSSSGGGSQLGAGDQPFGCGCCWDPAEQAGGEGDAGGEAGATGEIAPGTAQAQVVAVLQSDPHTRDLLRMGVVTGLAIAVHNLPEGLATFVGALNSTKVGASIAAAIAIHNIPEGICVAVPIYYATGSKWKGFFWGSLTGLVEPLGGLLGFLVLHERDALSFGIVFAIVAGMMTYVAVKELLPSAFRFDPIDRVASTSLLVGMAVMAVSLLLFTI